jgi:hypothetical protein
MVNLELRNSAILCGVMTTCALLTYYTDSKKHLAITYIVGIISSVLNHGNTSTVLKWFDRTWMVVAAVVDAKEVVRQNIQFLGTAFLLSAISCYFFAKLVKKENKTKVHSGSHYLVTCLNIYLLAC